MKKNTRRESRAKAVWLLVKVWIVKDFFVCKLLLRKGKDDDRI